MSSKDYKKMIMDGLLKKWNERNAKNIVTTRRIILKPTDLYKNYAKNNADITEKQNINEAAADLSRRGFISVDYLKFSAAIEKMYLSEERIEDIYDYLKTEYGVVPQNVILGQVQKIVEPYTHTGGIVQKYCEYILAQTEDPRCAFCPERVEENLKIFLFLEKNQENLYVREVSMLVYGDSKWFENNNYEEVCTFLRSAAGKSREESERNDEILGLFYVTPAEQEIFIKGSWVIEWEGYTLDIARLQSGIAIASGDVPSIKRICVNAENIMTIENKTSYQRMKDTSSAMMYLGGFANRYQIAFLKKVISDMPQVTYRHFGDIDIGGFLIHKHLCRETGKIFELYCMGIQQLSDIRFENCLRELTDHDRGRLEVLMEDTSYREVLMYMKAHNVKLEQEIVSYYM